MTHLILAAATKPLMVPRARSKVMKPDQVNVLTAAVFGDLHQGRHALEPGFASEVVGNVLASNAINRVDDDGAVRHRVAASDFDTRTDPDANGALDAPAPDAVAELFRE